MADFYSSMYALYVSNGDPVVGVTLTFIHMMVRKTPNTKAMKFKTTSCFTSS